MLDCITYFVSYHLACWYPTPNPNHNSNPDPKVGGLFHKMCELYPFSATRLYCTFFEGVGKENWRGRSCSPMMAPHSKNNEIARTGGISKTNNLHTSNSQSGCFTFRPIARINFGGVHQPPTNPNFWPFFVDKSGLLGEGVLHPCTPASLYSTLFIAQY